MRRAQPVVGALGAGGGKHSGEGIGGGGSGARVPRGWVEASCGPWAGPLGAR